MEHRPTLRRQKRRQIKRGPTERFLIGVMMGLLLIGVMMTCAHAGPFLKLGLYGLADDNFVITHRGSDISDDAFGLAEIGVRGHPAEWLAVECSVWHMSSVENEVDGGINWYGCALDFEYR